MLQKNSDFVRIDLACLECSKHCVGSPGTQPRLQKPKGGCRIDDSEDQHSICSEIDQSYKYNSDPWHYLFGWSSVLCCHISMNLFTTEWIIIIDLEWSNLTNMQKSFVGQSKLYEIVGFYLQIEKLSISVPKSSIETSASNSADCRDWITKLQSGPSNRQTRSEPS